MTVAKKKAEFCRRMQAVHRVQRVEASRQGAFQARPAGRKWADLSVPGVCQSTVSEVPEAAAGQPLESAALPAKAVSGS